MVTIKPVPTRSTHAPLDDAPTATPVSRHPLTEDQIERHVRPDHSVERCLQTLPQGDALTPLQLRLREAKAAAFTPSQVRQIAATLLERLGYQVAVDETRVVQNGRFVAAPSAPHFMWHELGHALAYLADDEPRTPLASWFPEPAWIEALNLPEWESDQLVNVFAHDLATRCGLDGVPGGRRASELPSLPPQIRQRVRERAEALLFAASETPP